jgi:hypothetical protein
MQYSVDTTPYEYFEEHIMFEYISSIYSTLLSGILSEHKHYQILDPTNKIEEITEEISELSEFDSYSRLF